MKLKYLIFGIIFSMLIITSFNVLLNTVNAKEETYDIKVINTSSKYLKTENHGGNTFVYYEISITLQNTGNIASDELSIRLRDEDGNYTKEVVISPGEYKTIIWDNHMFLGSKQRTVYFDYYAEDLEKRTSSNTGSTILVIDPDNSGVSATSNTPGFEVIILLSSILIFYIFKK